MHGALADGVSVGDLTMSSRFAIGSKNGRVQCSIGNWVR